MIHSLLRWFYCLPMGDAALLMVLAGGCFLLLRRRFGSKTGWRIGVCAALMAWVAVAAYATLAGREPGDWNQPAILPFHSYRAVMNGANPELLRSNFMNVALFYPGGLLAASLLPESWPRWRRGLLTLVGFAAVSAGIECVQYVWGLGLAEADDVLHNALGACLGWACCELPAVLRKRFGT